MPTAPLCGTLTAAKWATATAFPASRVHSALFFERPALTPRTAWGRAEPLPLAGSNPSDATRRNALRTCPGVCGLDRIETTLLDETSQEGRIQIPPDFRSVRKLVKPLVQSLLCVCAIHVAELRKASVPRPNSISSRPGLLRRMLTNIPAPRTLPWPCVLRSAVPLAFFSWPSKPWILASNRGGEDLLRARHCQCYGPRPA
jgi:hypothetical protein